MLLRTLELFILFYLFLIIYLLFALMKSFTCSLETTICTYYNFILHYNMLNLQSFRHNRHFLQILQFGLVLQPSLPLIFYFICMYDINLNLSKKLVITIRGRDKGAINKLIFCMNWL